MKVFISSSSSHQHQHAWLSDYQQQLQPHSDGERSASLQHLILGWRKPSSRPGSRSQEKESREDHNPSPQTLSSNTLLLLLPINNLLLDFFFSCPPDWKKSKTQSWTWSNYFEMNEFPMPTTSSNANWISKNWEHLIYSAQTWKFIEQTFQWNIYFRSKYFLAR